ncbi:MAG: hypothetical protein K2W96_08290 [Gemmataceae bacterium]|nr:hypothetical protein [Gemmataceae bacterium]
MDQGPLVSEWIEARAKLLPEFDKYAPLSVAFWLKDSDTGNWRLWLASPKISSRNFDIAYSEIGRLTRQMTYPSLDSTQVHMARGREKEVKAILAELARRGGKHPFRLRQEMAHGVYFEEAYAYPSLVPVEA